MKSGKWNLITAMGYLTAAVCLAFAAILYDKTPSKILCGIAAACFLIGSIGFFCIYKKKNHNKQSGL